MKVRRHQRFERCLGKLRQLIGLGGIRSNLLLAYLPDRGPECLMLLSWPIHLRKRAHLMSLFGCWSHSSAHTVRCIGSQSSGSSGGLSTELATSTKARESTDSAIAIMVSRT